MLIELNFHTKGFTIGLALKQRWKATWNHQLQCTVQCLHPPLSFGYYSSYTIPPSPPQPHIVYLQTFVMLPDRSFPLSVLVLLLDLSLASISAWLSLRWRWYDGGRSSVGTDMGSVMPLLACSAKCIAIANSSMFSWPSLSKSARFLEEIQFWGYSTEQLQLHIQQNKTERSYTLSFLFPAPSKFLGISCLWLLLWILNKHVSFIYCYAHTANTNTFTCVAWTCLNEFGTHFYVHMSLSCTAL